VSDFLRSWLGVGWSDPRVIAGLIAIAVIALVRRWSLVLLLILIVALGQGLQYLLRHSALGQDFTRGTVIGVYVFGGILFLFLAIAHMFTKE
jgi:hypothetical protein